MAGHAVSVQQDGNGALTQAAGLSRYDAYVENTEDGLNRLIVTVDGVHCAACIQKIESALQDQPQVREARLNFSTRRLTILWLGPVSDGDSFAGIIEKLGYRVQPFDPRDLSRDEEKEGRFLLMCVGVAGFAAGNIMLLSAALWSASGEVMGFAMRDFMHFLAGIIAVPAVAFSGRPFFRSAAAALSKGHTNMDVPISLALVLTIGMSISESLRHAEHVYFDSAVMLAFFLLIGRYLDFRARASARDAAGGLLAMMAGTATVIEGNKRRAVRIRDLRPEMSVLVAAGERIPADSTVIEGHSEIDTSLVTGESIPRAAAPGDHLYSGTMNMASPLTLKVARAAEDSLLADIVRLMEKAEQGQARYTRLADRAARLYTPVVHTLAAGTFLGWLLLGGIAWQNALMIAVTVLIITCPCALGLAVPVVQVLAIGKLMKRNILVKSGDALERLAAVDTILFDKTGTLTLGRPELEHREQYDDITMHLAASIAGRSKHPLAKALAASWDGPVDAIAVKEYPGKGLEAEAGGRRVKIGSAAWCGAKGSDIVPGRLELWLAVEGQEPVAFHFADRLRPDARDVIDQLKARGYDLYLLSGDRAEAAESVANDLGIENRRGGMSPSEKYDYLQQLEAKGRHTLMLGDGLNDAPVLAGASVSIAPSTAIDMAQNAASIIFMGEKLQPVLSALNTAKFSQKLVHTNFTLAVVYNIIAIPMAVLGYVTPMIAALAMSGSSLVVIANSFRLRWRKD